MIDGNAAGAVVRDVAADAAADVVPDPVTAEVVPDVVPDPVADAAGRVAGDVLAVWGKTTPSPTVGIVASPAASIFIGNFPEQLAGADTASSIATALTDSIGGEVIDRAAAVVENVPATRAGDIASAIIASFTGSAGGGVIDRAAAVIENVLAT
jgi:hypothetical protein